MGEAQGSLWTTGLFIILFVGMATMLFWAIDIMQYNSTIYSIEDNIKAGNFDYIATLSDKYTPCGQAYTTNSNCTGITEINEEQHYVQYQVSFNGLIMNVSAAENQDFLVLLPY